MAKSLGGKKKKSAKSARRKQSGTAPASGVGHNSRIPPAKEVMALYKVLDNLHDEKEKNAAEYMADIKQAYETAANKLGLPRKVIREEYQERRHQMKRKQRIDGYDPNEVEALDRLEASIGEDTPFGRYAAELAAQKRRDTSEPSNDSAEAGFQKEEDDEVEDEDDLEDEGAGAIN